MRDKARCLYISYAYIYHMYIHTDTPNLAPEVPAKDSMQHARLRGAAVRRGAELERLCVCVCVCVRVYVCVYMNI